jgi:nucleotide-binding universal stress UspA family protein
MARFGDAQRLARDHRRAVAPTKEDAAMNESTVQVPVAETQEARPGPILVPLDQSERSEAVLAMALALEKQMKTGLHLLSVPPLHHLEIAAYQQYPGGRLPPEHIASPEALVAESRAETETYLKELAERWSSDEVNISTQVRDEMPAEAIAHSAAEVNAALIVMATHGRGGISRWALGSVADKVVQTASTPVLLMRETEGQKLEHLLVPLDGSELAEGVLAEVEQLASATGATVTLLQIVSLTNAMPMVPSASVLKLEKLAEEGAAEYLEGVADRLRARGVDTRCEVISGDDIAATLLERVEAENCDMVAMATHGRGGLRRWAFGSVADRLIRNAQKPVLIVRPGTM